MTGKLVIQVERLPKPEVIWDLHQLVSVTVYGYLHLGTDNMILDSPEKVDALEAMLDTARAADGYRVLLPQNEHMALAPGSKSRSLATSVDRMRGLVQLTAPLIDKNCVTTSDGDCISEAKCMHD